MHRALVQGLTGLIFPSHCLLCRRRLKGLPETVNLCGSCQASITINRPPFCQRCSRPPDPRDFSAPCPECRRSRYHFDRVVGITQYDETMKHLVHLFKYGQKTALRRDFARITAAYVRHYGISLLDHDLVAPVPLHPARRRERGYNQSDLLGQELARLFPVAYHPGLLRRVRHTPNQARLNGKERWTNIQGAFRIRHPQSVRDKSILLIDDLMTTGATLSEIAFCLKSAGARKVEALTLAVAC